MKTLTRTKLSMAARARDYAEAHPISDGSFTTVLKRLDGLVALADQMAVQEQTGVTDEHAGVVRRQTLREDISIRLKRLVRVAELAAKTDPDLAVQFRMPVPSVPNKTFFTIAQALLTAATPHKDFLISLGLGDTFFDDLTTMLTGSDGATDRAHNGRSDHVTACSTLDGMVKDCTRDVDIIGTFYLQTYPKGSEVLAGWKSARNVAGPFTKHNPTDPAPEPPPPPVTPPEEPPANP